MRHLRAKLGCLKAQLGCLRDDLGASKGKFRVQLRAALGCKKSELGHLVVICLTVHIRHLPHNLCRSVDQTIGLSVTLKLLPFRVYALFLCFSPLSFFCSIHISLFLDATSISIRSVRPSVDLVCPSVPCFFQTWKKGKQDPLANDATSSVYDHYLRSF